MGQGDNVQLGAEGINPPVVTAAPGRAVNTTFQPDAARPCFVAYSIRILCDSANDAATVTLQSAPAGAALVARAEVQLRSSAAAIVESTMVLSWLVPAGWNVRLQQSTTNTPTVTIVQQSEVHL